MGVEDQEERSEPANAGRACYHGIIILLPGGPETYGRDRCADFVTDQASDLENQRARDSLTSISGPLYTITPSGQKCEFSKQRVR